MRKIYNYIPALGFFASLGLAWLPILELSSFKFSLYDIGNIAFDKNIYFEGLIEEAGQVLQEYLQPILYLLIVWVILILLAGICCIFLKQKAAYYSSLLFVIVINIYTLGTGYIAIQKIEETKEAFNFFDLNLNIGLNITTSILWIALYIFIFGFAFYGLHQCKKTSACEIIDTAMPEDFRHNENPWEDHQDITRLDISSSQQFNCIKEKTPSNFSKSSVYADFYGVLIGTGVLYHDYAYELDEKAEVYFHNTQNSIEVYSHHTSESIVSLYYIPEYQEYCLKPLKLRCVYLESGQPLGKDRYYYLPRGMSIYLLKQEYSFLLG